MDAYVKLAVNTIHDYIKDRRIYRPAPGELPEEMLTKRAGAFVSIHKGDALRGCIGTLGPVRDNIAEEIISNAISASTRDPRFPAVTEDELKDLTINVDVLTEPEYIASKDELDVKRYGVIVRKGRRTG
ncbi:MAG: AmmeMemoRadiSam system protein A, partial [Lachnospiraceae bacterium]|nr:AmmeMemoRadiSam system protein A [Lachnospiraceae bacterium]